MTRKDEQLGKTHFFTKEKVFIACIIALLLIVAYFFGKSNSLYLGSSGIHQEPTPTAEAIETPVPTSIPTDKPIPFPKTNTIPSVSPAPVIINTENNSIQEEQKIQNIEFCQKEMNDYNTCINTYSTNYQNYLNCTTQYKFAMQRYQDQIARGETFLVMPTNYCAAMPISFCSKPNCLY